VHTLAFKEALLSHFKETIQAATTDNAVGAPKQSLIRAFLESRATSSSEAPVDPRRAKDVIWNQIKLERKRLERKKQEPKKKEPTKKPKKKTANGKVEKKKTADGKEEKKKGKKKN
jgi:hypothetical protein